MNDEWDMIPPIPPMVTVGEGISEEGAQWCVRVGGSRSSCWTFMYITLPNGLQVGGGGMGGPVLLPGRTINYSIHQTDNEVSYMVARVHLTIKVVQLAFVNGSPPSINLSPFGENASLNVAFVAAVLPKKSRLETVAVWDSQGRCVDRNSTEQSMAFLEKGFPRLEVGEIGTEGISGWRPV